MNTLTQRLMDEARETLGSFDIEALRKNGLFPLNGDYFPAIYYPPIPMCPPGTEEDLFAKPDDPERPLSFYVHIPFCPFRCVFCHWMVTVGQSAEKMDAYLDYVDREIELYQAKFAGRSLRPKSILLGGGTPTTLAPRLIEKLFGIMRSRLDLSECAQITCEAEPTTVLGEEGLEKLVTLRKLGVERISFGAQTFDEQMLKDMGRRHTPDDVGRAVEQTRRAGFESVSLDLIYGFAGCTIENWTKTLETALDLGIDACQLYRLRIVPHGDKPGGVGKIQNQKPEIFPELEDLFMMKELGILYCRERGYTETSRRVFARSSGYDSEYLRDHTARLSDVLGVGISAWSSIQGHMSINTSKSMETYYSFLEKGKLPIDRGQVRSREETCRWAMTLPIKAGCVVKDYYEELTGHKPHDVFGKKIEALTSFGLVEDRGDRVCLTTKGKFFADEVAIQFYNHSWMPFPEEKYATGALNPYNTQLEAS